MKKYTLNVYVGKDLYKKLDTLGKALNKTPNQIMGCLIRDNDLFSESLQLLADIVSIKEISETIEQLKGVKA